MSPKSGRRKPKSAGSHQPVPVINVTKSIKKTKKTKTPIPMAPPRQIIPTPGYRAVRMTAVPSPMHKTVWRRPVGPLNHSPSKQSPRPMIVEKKTPVPKRAALMKAALKITQTYLTYTNPKRSKPKGG